VGAPKSPCGLVGAGFRRDHRSGWPTVAIRCAVGRLTSPSLCHPSWLVRRVVVPLWERTRQRLLSDKTRLKCQCGQDKGALVGLSCAWLLISGWSTKAGAFDYRSSQPDRPRTCGRTAGFRGLTYYPALTPSRRDQLSAVPGEPQC
jgi:hypothetical protein